jgi:Tfp pilus assembly protein PilO
MFGFTLSPVAAHALRTLLPLAVLAGSSAGLTGGLAMLVHDPAQEHVRTAQAAYDAARQAQSRQQAARRTQEGLAKIWRALPDRKEFSSVILAIVDLAQQNRIAIPGMNYTLKTVAEGLPLKASITFQVSGEYAAIRRFIHRMETDERYLTVESLDVSRSSLRSGPDGDKDRVTESVRFNMRITTYLRPGTQQAAKRA